MSTLINYLFESSVLLGGLTVFYWLILHKEPLFRFNRLFLLSSLLLAALLPFLKIPMFVQVSESSIEYTKVMTSITIYAENTRKNLVPIIESIPGFKWIYMTGVCGLLIRLVYGFIRVGAISGKASLTGYKGYKIADLPGQFSPFSFFNVIFVNRSLYSNRDIEQVLEHEMAHVRFKHSWDVLLLEILLIVQWFNPFAWLLRSLLKELHEFQADRVVLSSGTSIGRYKELLLFQVTGARLLPVNNLNQSLTKKRFIMMTKYNSKTYGVAKIASALLVVIGLTITLAIDAQVKDKKSDKDQIEIVPVSQEEVCEIADVMPQYPGGQEKLIQFIIDNLKYPDSAKKAGKTGKVFVSFVVKKSGKVASVKVVRSSGHKELDDAAIDVVKKMPDWTPGEKDGKVVNVAYTLPLNFALD